MKKIKTNIGYMYLPEERTNNTISAPFNERNKYKEINTIVITSADSKRLYRTANPYGVGYTDCFDCILTSHHSRIKLTAGKPERKIDFIEIS